MKNQNLYIRASPAPCVADYEAFGTKLYYENLICLRDHDVSRKPIWKMDCFQSISNTVGAIFNTHKSLPMAEEINIYIFGRLWLIGHATDFWFIYFLHHRKNTKYIIRFDCNFTDLHVSIAFDHVLFNLNASNSDTNGRWQMMAGPTKIYLQT